MGDSAGNHLRQNANSSKHFSKPTARNWTASLRDDFLLIDALSGSEFQKPALLAAVASCQVKFEKIGVSESRVRRYPGIAIVTCRTQMRGRFGEVPFSANSRYTHGYIEQQGLWRLVSAQGTPRRPDLNCHDKSNYWTSNGKDMMNAPFCGLVTAAFSA